MLDVKKWMAKVSAWINNPTVTKSSGNSSFIANRSDTGTIVWFGVGSGGVNHGIWSVALNSWMIYSDGTHVYIPEVTITGHSSPIGTMKKAWLASDANVASGTATALCSISLEAGTWIINCGVRFPTNNSGWRRANFTATSGATDYHMNVTATSGGITQLNFTRIESITSTTTFYLNAYHNAGSALTMPAGGDNWGNYIRAIRIS